MTAEVIIMNKNGVAMAADSAATLTNSFGRGKVYNSANKLFRLSKISSIGILIFDNSNINNIPWELIIKRFRSRTNKSKWSSVRECTSAFVQYLNLNDIDKEKSENWYVKDVIERVLNSFSENFNKIIIQTIKNSSNQIIQDAEIEKGIRDFLENELNTLEKNKIFEGIPKSIEREIDSRYGNYIASRIEGLFANIQRFFHLSPLVHTLCLKVLYRVNKWSSHTGIAVCGYGADEYFPECIVLNAYGLLSGHLLYTELMTSKITVEDEVLILPLAQSDVANTFICGMSPHIKSNIGQLVENIKNNLIKSLEDNLLVRGVIYPKNKESVKVILKTTIDKYYEAFGRNIEILLQENASAITSAVVNLSIPDLAQMAKNLVEMTSFKRRVSLDLETVGGPIDVAVISKGDGFIWIDRKHYFKRELNEHFFDGYKDR